MKRALILGISGQDGAYLAQQLLQLNYLVFGTMPDASTRPFRCLKSLGIFNQVKLFQLSQQDFPSVLRLLKTLRVDEIYNLSAQVECGKDEGHTTCEPDLEQGALNVLEAMRILRNGERYLFVASGEHTDLARQTGAQVLTENREPSDPAFAAEAMAARQVALYRAQFGVYACTGVFYNRESPLQPGFAISRQISGAAARIARGSTEKLLLPDRDEVREWGWAPEYAVAMRRILQHPAPGDFVIGRGKAHSVADFAEAAFSSAGLDWQQHVQFGSGNGSAPAARIAADPAPAYRMLGWRAEIAMEGVASLMVSNERIRGIL